MSLCKYVLSILLLASCVHTIPIKIDRAIAVIKPSQGYNISGIVYFDQKKDYVSVKAKIYGLRPGQKHGFHVHEFGDLSANDGSSAGDHYNPENHPHALPPKLKRHAGSYGNIQADSQGNATFILKDYTSTILGLKNPIIGRAVIIHANEDTGIQPSGGAGKRIGMGVIGVRK